MKLVIQRVKRASVTIDSELFSEISNGLLVLVGVSIMDTVEDVEYLAAKTVNMRIFDDENGVMNKSLIDSGGDILAVSQFTLLAATRKGNRPSYIHAAGHQLATQLYSLFCERCTALLSRTVQKGVFGADMQVELLNDGPVTIVIDSHDK